MTVAIHPSEARGQAAAAQASSRGRKPLLAGVGMLALAGFAAGSFSFFSNLADPRAKPRPVMTAASWPDLKDGVPALAESGTAPAPVLNLARAAPAEVAASVPSAPEAEPALQTAPVQGRASVPTPETAPGAKAPVHETKRVPPIENAATLAVPIKPVALVAPRPAAAIAPARAETVKAKPAQPSRFVSLSPDGGKPEAVAQKPRPAALNPAAPKAEQVKTQAKEQAKAPSKAPAAKQVAEAQPTPAPVPAPEEPEVMGVKIPGGRQLREGIQAVGSLFGGD